MLRNEDYTDRELLHVVSDVTTVDGWADTEEIAERLGMAQNGGRRHVGSRMSWMVRYKYCERKVEGKGERVLYRLTKQGKSLMAGELDSDTESVLKSMEPGERVMVMRVIARQGFSTASPAQDMLRREYLHHYAKRKRAKRKVRV